MLSYDSDIALMQLDIPLEYNTAVRQVCLSNSTEMLSSSSLCTASGRGIIEEGGCSDFACLPIMSRTYISILYFILLPRPNLKFISQADESRARRLQQTRVPVLENEIYERS